MVMHMIPKRLREARKRAGLTGAKLALLAGIDESTAASRISQYESGTYTPKYQTVCQLADILDVPDAYFYARDDELAEIIYQIHKYKKMP